MNIREFEQVLVELGKQYKDSKDRYKLIAKNFNGLMKVMDSDKRATKYGNVIVTFYGALEDRQFTYIEVK